MTRYKPSEKKIREVLKFEPHINQEMILRNMKRFTCITAGRRFGKTALASYLAFYYLLHADKTIWIVAPTYDLAKRTWQYIYGWVLRHAPNMKINLSNLSIQCPETNSILELKTAENPASCIGAGVDFLIVDEASRIKTQVWEEALYPTLSDKKGKAVFISTPKGKNWFYELYLKGQEEGYEDYASFSFESKDNLALPHMEEEQEKAKHALPQASYEQEYLAKFLDNAGQVFRNIKACVKGKFREYEREHAYIMGVDLAKYEDYTAITVVDLTDFHVVHFDRFNKLDYEYQIERIKNLHRKYHAPVVIDSTGVGNPIAERLERDGLPIHAYKYTNASKKFLIENLALKLEQGEITFPEIKELIHELEVFEYEFSPKSQMIRYNAPAGYHDDCVNSLALAVWGAGHYAQDIVPFVEPFPTGSLGELEEQLERQEREDALKYFI